MDTNDPLERAVRPRERGEIWTDEQFRAAREHDLTERTTPVLRAVLAVLGCLLLALLLTSGKVVEIAERQGTLLGLLEDFLDGLNIVEFQYGKSHNEKAWPVIGFEASPAELDRVTDRLREQGVQHERVTSEEDVDFRIIHYDSALISHPFFIKLEFHERAGALHDFLKAAGGRANLCYFNYLNTGERVGRALLGFEFDSARDRDRFRQDLGQTGRAYRACQEVSAEVLKRVL